VDWYDTRRTPRRPQVPSLVGESGPVADDRHSARRLDRGEPSDSLTPRNMLQTSGGCRRRAHGEASK
jgi:hypothetical protein